jgi:hypothetical protein
MKYNIAFKIAFTITELASRRKLFRNWRSMVTEDVCNFIE